MIWKAVHFRGSNRTWLSILVFCISIYHLGSITKRYYAPVDFTIRHNLGIDVRPKYIFGKDIKTISDSMQIPHIIHQTAKDGVLPNVLQPWMKSWLRLNPDWQYWFWSDVDIRHFIATRYPDFLPIFDSYKIGVSRADVFRYFALYEFGGVYADTDIECLKPLDRSISEQNCILSQEPYLHALFHYNQKKVVANSYMACGPRHQFYKFLINRLQFHAKHENVIVATGPRMMDHVYNEYIEQHNVDIKNIKSDHSVKNNGVIDNDINSENHIYNNNIANNYDIYLADPNIYQPKIDPRKINLYKNKCNLVLSNAEKPQKDIDFKVEICTPLLANDFDNKARVNSITIHHWMHSWKPKYKNDNKHGIKQKEGTFLIQHLYD